MSRFSIQGENQHKGEKKSFQKMNKTYKNVTLYPQSEDLVSPAEKKKKTLKVSLTLWTGGHIPVRYKTKC